MPLRQASRRQGTWDDFKAEEDGRFGSEFATQLTTGGGTGTGPARVLDRPAPAHASASGLGHIYLHRWTKTKRRPPEAFASSNHSRCSACQLPCSSLHWRTRPRCAPLLLWVGFVTGPVTPASSMSAHYFGLSSSSPGPLFLPMLRGSVGGLRASYARLAALDLASARSWPDACRGVSTETPHLHSCCVCLTRWEAAGAACGLHRKKSSLLFCSSPQHNFSLLCLPRACAEKIGSAWFLLRLPLSKSLPRPLRP